MSTGTVTSALNRTRFGCMALQSSPRLPCPPRNRSARLSRPTLLHSHTACRLLPRIRGLHTFFSSREYQPLPFENRFQLFNYYIPPEDRARTIEIGDAPAFTIEEDIRRLLDDFGFSAEFVLMHYNAFNGHKRLNCFHVVLPTTEDAQRAVKEVDDAPLFNKRVAVRLTKGPITELKDPELFWGWYGARKPGFENLRLRAPLLSPPTNVFASRREGRCMAVENIPEATKTPGLIEEIYNLFYSFDVEAVRYVVLKRRATKRSFTPFILFLNLVTAEQASAMKSTCDKHVLSTGHKLHISVSKPPMHVLGASWDNSRPKEHNSPRDQGSAVGTNFEYMQEELMRKWLLGENDRGIWVPGHKY